MTETSQVPARQSSREKLAERLLNSSAARSYDPEIDIDWSAPLPEDKYFLPEHRVSLYGTELWEQLTPEQGRELGKHEIISITSFGIFAEVALMHLLLKVVTQGDPTTRHAQYALTEVADECRHSTMFGRGIEASGVGPYLAPWWFKHLLNLSLLLPIGPATYGGTLLVEELLDRLQRETLADENMQPTIRMINKIHVLEEARHISFARAEVTRMVPKMGRIPLAVNRLALAFAAPFLVRLSLHPDVYRSVGLDPKQARKVARANPHHRESIRWMGERITKFLTEAGMIEGALTKALWRRSFLLGKPMNGARQ
ncbi:AurF N-oxygenase family protein [Pseudonocardia spinosispora]|uniref:AurF N-oxygenase family protein n=1 Tax=Pseudonocardia spinosispora TaxID=103441 RepID=UPI00040CC501|nr:diiron oxygenase [Pseudonocardia spinosispora]